AAMRAQQVELPFEILLINNNSSDTTRVILERLACQPGVALRWVTEPVQGIVAARNRGLAEAMGSDILVFIDDDELPQPGLLTAATDAILNEGAQCAGGRVDIDFSTHARPAWLGDELLGFLAAVDHGTERFWIEDDGTPIWTANVAYDMRLFREDTSLRFDKRYDRVGKGVGGGEDVMMLRSLLLRGARIRYRPDMAVWHSVEPWRLKRGYFLSLHYRAGKRQAELELPGYARTILGVPPFLVVQLMRQCWRTLRLVATGKSGALRQAMNAAFAWGSIVGCARRGPKAVH
ncbi:MAG: glycosyltransferase family 2 protein, partial [Burkholderiaceae bacterium]|nr:glycosyltransferase family 2 protein [Burkholderiaceae bacterium]